ncbi:Tom7-domain-containing protein [Lentinus tigrinus ALCF2SS1-7]|uniref:Tom7-domain-containing protein n=2 Tax=Polyporaceae TaxID=5317 RepID=A0A5C2SSV3_9APHY|nr:Tom7-domain-containing protein [Lentinus tigrinus ALCF2SS1-6]RPD80877.1 Tom7-domain-containing protein [Lentinus tigrinus ALCF2SS1-7]
MLSKKLSATPGTALYASLHVHHLSTPKMPSEETKERIIKAVDLARTVVHYGWIPFIIYVGYTRSNPQPSLIKLISPLA